VYSKMIHPDDRGDFVLWSKIDLHRHLEGSMRVETLQKIAAWSGICSENRLEYYKLAQVQPDDPLDFKNFLGKFAFLRKFFTSQEMIEQITAEAIDDAASDNILHLELRFTPAALNRERGYSLEHVMEWVCHSAAAASRKAGISTCLIASINRHESPALAAEVAELAAAFQSEGITGLDLAGNEAEFPTRPFADIFRRAKQNGLRITIHAGEWGGAENVREAIEIFEADRIGHGVRVLEDPEVVRLARRRGIPFEVCLTSNLQTGVVPDLADHPLRRMLDENLTVTLNTDDPGVSNTTLSKEYQVAVEILGLRKNILLSCILSAAQASFLSEPKKRDLQMQLSNDLQNE
jgi:adenosine deaminase